jgi:hypothetical protein
VVNEPRRRGRPPKTDTLEPEVPETPLTPHTSQAIIPTVTQVRLFAETRNGKRAAQREQEIRQEIIHKGQRRAMTMDLTAALGIHAVRKLDQTQQLISQQLVSVARSPEMNVYIGQAAGELLEHTKSTLLAILDNHQKSVMEDL